MYTMLFILHNIFQNSRKMSKVHHRSRTYADGQKKKNTHKTLDYSSTNDKIQFIGIRNRRRVQARGVADVRAVRWADVRGPVCRLVVILINPESD